MKTDELMLKVENVSKIYKLGEIGGTTLRDELQRLLAKLRKKEDPTKKIGAKNYNKGEKFKALDNISFEVKKGERIGIIGHNGAGKSTLLKLISRVTGPTEGKIHLNGRVASMLEVGTGFHPELTGRENVYMNGAILGMTKKEIDAKMENIIEFSEVRQFIDTPVKRYSSGMYVKLAFSVAAHLDSEIMIMDEVLAVGDMAFQNKCLTKMKDVSEQDNRAILYVSHNMNTIRQLCDRVIVLGNGHIIYDGNVEEGISFYVGHKSGKYPSSIKLSHSDRPSKKHGVDLRITEFHFIGKNEAIFNTNEFIDFKIAIKPNKIINDLHICLFVETLSNEIIGISQSKKPLIQFNNTNQKDFCCRFKLNGLAPGDYLLFLDVYSLNQYNDYLSYDHPTEPIAIKVTEDTNLGLRRSQKLFGNIDFDEIVLTKEN